MNSVLRKMDSLPPTLSEAYAEIEKISHPRLLTLAFAANAGEDPRQRAPCHNCGRLGHWTSQMQSRLATLSQKSDQSKNEKTKKARKIRK